MPKYDTTVIHLKKFSFILIEIAHRVYRFISPSNGGGGGGTVVSFFYDFVNRLDCI